MALKLGYPNVDRMLRQMTYKQFIEWQIFAELEPFDEERDDVRTASIVQILANINRNPKKQKAPYSLEEMRLRFGDSPAYVPKKKDWKSMKEIAKMIAMGKQPVP